MTFYPDEKIAIFIDGSNFFSAAKAIGLEVDYQKLLSEFKKRGRLTRAAYYTAVLNTQDHVSIKPLVDWLAYNGWVVVQKPAKEFVDNYGVTRIKGNMDIDMAVDMLELAPNVDHMILCSGDGDFRRLVEAVQRHGVRVTVISTYPIIAAELRRQADTYVDLKSLVSLISRDMSADYAGRYHDDEDYDDEYEDDAGPDSEDLDEDADLPDDEPAD